MENNTKSEDLIKLEGVMSHGQQTYLLHSLGRVLRKINGTELDLDELKL